MEQIRKCLLNPCKFLANKIDAFNKRSRKLGRTGIDPAFITGKVLYNRREGVINLVQRCDSHAKLFTTILDVPDLFLQRFNLRRVLGERFIFKFGVRCKDPLHRLKRRVDVDPVSLLSSLLPNRRPAKSFQTAEGHAQARALQFLQKYFQFRPNQVQAERAGEHHGHHDAQRHLKQKTKRAVVK